MTARNEVPLIPHSSSGQATLEAMVLISLGILFLFSIHSIGTLRSQTLDLLGKSTYLSYLSRNEISNDSSRVVSLKNAVYAPAVQTISQELGVNLVQLSRASAYKTVGTTKLYQAIQPILNDKFERHSFLLSGSGHSASNEATQNSISNAETLWRKSFSQSKKTVTQNALPSQRVDYVWRRSEVSTEWLLPWANEVGTSTGLTP